MERSAQLLDADQVARRVTECAVAHPVGLFGRFLDDIGTAGLDPFEDTVEVLGGQKDPAVSGWFGGLTVIQRILPRPTSVRTSNPRVPGERAGGVRVVVREEAGVNGDGHGFHANCGSAPVLLVVGHFQKGRQTDRLPNSVVGFWSRGISWCRY